MNWKKSTEENADKDFEARVLKAAAPLLAQNAELAKARGGRAWITIAVPALGLGALILVIALGKLPGRPAGNPEELSPEMEIAMDFDLIYDLHEVEQLETLKALGEKDQWPNKLRKKKS